MIFEAGQHPHRVSASRPACHQLGGSVVHLTTATASWDAPAHRGLGARHQPHDRHRDDPHLRASQDQRPCRTPRVPVINGLTNEFPPPPDPGLDIFTGRAPRRHHRQGRGLGGRRQQHGQHLAAGGRILGFTVHVSTPSGYEIDRNWPFALAPSGLQGGGNPMDALPRRRPQIPDVDQHDYEAEKRQRKRRLPTGAWTPR